MAIEDKVGRNIVHFVITEGGIEEVKYNTQEHSGSKEEEEQLDHTGR